MTVHLGGPESAEKLRERQGRYERMTDPAAGRSLKIVLEGTGEGVGWVGYWTNDWRGEHAFEIGWSVVTEHQGRGIATRATALALDLAREHKERRYVYAMPAIENGASNGVCRKLGFELLGPVDFEYPPGHLLHCNDWRYDLAGHLPTV
jgi:RimJ/RimL family protein N-acetyltransferase